MLIHIETDEEAAFWDWACVETLRHSGVRIEELCELTHLSIRQENPKYTPERPASRSADKHQRPET